MFDQREVTVHRWGLYGYNGLRAELRASKRDCAHKLHVMEEQVAVLREAARRHGVATAANQHHIRIL